MTMSAFIGTVRRLCTVSYVGVRSERMHSLTEVLT